MNDFESELMALLDDHEASIFIENDKMSVWYTNRDGETVILEDVEHIDYAGICKE